MIKHIVLLQFNNESSTQAQQKCINAFLDLSTKIKEVIDFDQGANVSNEGMSHGYTHSAVMTFADAEARDRYLFHPEHLAFVESLKPVLSDAVAFDYEF
ncbi:Dabb family protein [Undibacterium sp. Dicai25W]|uniref:Dabb family protein n=1 Tax=Undibacterium sp. Dicai25W TaxID=3413034 RepID=UPI003BEFD7A7